MLEGPFLYPLTYRRVGVKALDERTKSSSDTNVSRVASRRRVKVMNIIQFVVHKEESEFPKTRENSVRS